MINLCFLGTGSAEPATNRNNLSFLVSDKAGDRMVLVDCSGAPVQTILRLGYQPEYLTDVILTHSSTIYALPSLVHTLWLYKQFDNEKGSNLGEEETPSCKKLVDVFS